VARRDGEHVTGADFGLGAVVHVDLHVARHAVAEVRDLAGVGSGDRLDVVGPPPARLKDGPADHLAGEVANVGLALSLERTSLVRRVEVLHL
jgi:hypothetical protein